jgi:hypothetical protein
LARTFGWRPRLSGRQAKASLFLIKILGPFSLKNLKMRNGGGYRDRTGDLLIAKTIEGDTETNENGPSSGKNEESE